MERDQILIVEDDAAERRAMLRSLRDVDADVYEAASAEEGLEILASGRIHVLIADQQMGGMSGVDLLVMVKALHPRVVSMMVTGDPELDTALRAINETGVYKYIRKPWKVRDFVMNVTKACRLARFLERGGASIPDLRPRTGDLPFVDDVTEMPADDAKVVTADDVRARWEALTDAQRVDVYERSLEIFYDRALCEALGVNYEAPEDDAYKVYDYAMRISR